MASPMVPALTDHELEAILAEGREAGAVFDRLADAQLALSRGEDGTGKYLSVTHSTLRIIAERRPSTLTELQRIQGMGDQKVERFGEAFLSVLREA